MREQSPKSLIISDLRITAQNSHICLPSCVWWLPRDSQRTKIQKFLDVSSVSNRKQLANMRYKDNPRGYRDTSAEAEEEDQALVCDRGLNSFLPKGVDEIPIWFVRISPLLRYCRNASGDRHGAGPGPLSGESGHRSVFPRSGRSPGREGCSGRRSCGRSGIGWWFAQDPTGHRM